MAKRWVHRPEGSTWGEWGDDDELGRINLMTPAKVLQGVAEVKEGISFCLSLPLDFPGGTLLNQRRFPPRVSPTVDMDGNPDVFYNVHMSEMPDWGDPKYVDVWADDTVTLSLQYSTQWDSLAHVGAEFDADGDGVEEAVYYNGYRAGIDLVGPHDDAGGDGCGHRSFAKHLGLEHMAFHGVQGRGVLVDIEKHLGREYRGVRLDTLREIMAADNYAVEGMLGKDRHPHRHAFLPLHHLCLFKLGVPLGELWYLHELAHWLREHGRSRFLLTAPPLRLPGVVGSPVTPIATV